MERELRQESKKWRTREGERALPIHVTESGGSRAARVNVAIKSKLIIDSGMVAVSQWPSEVRCERDCT